MSRKWWVLAACGALAGLLALPATALAQQKTAKQCNAEWTANRAAIEASGKKKRDFMAECRGGTAAKAAPTAQQPSQATAPARQPSPTSASAKQKTVKQCNAEWTANRAAIQATGKLKRDFIEECRSGTAAQTAPPPRQPSQATAPAAREPATSPKQTATPQPAPAPKQAPAQRPSTVGVATAPGQHATAAAARASCPGDTVVWVNLNSKIYHYSNAKAYGHTKSGTYMCERDTGSAGYRAAKNAKRPPS